MSLLSVSEFFWPHSASPHLWLVFAAPESFAAGGEGGSGRKGVGGGVKKKEPQPTGKTGKYSILSPP